MVHGTDAARAPGRKTVKTLNSFNGPGSLKAKRQQRRREQFKIMVWFDRDLEKDLEKELRISEFCGKQNKNGQADN